MEIQDNSGFLVDTQMRLDKSLTKDCDTDHDQPTSHQENNREEANQLVHTPLPHFPN